MRIGINGRVLQERMSGIPLFTLALVEGLAEQETCCGVHLFLLNQPFADAGVQERLENNPRIVRHFSRWSGNSYLSRALWDLVFLGLEAKRYNSAPSPVRRLLCCYSKRQKIIYMMTKK
ncbi:hypothetical protein HKBW3S09_01954 [Candidatus Hakubella thermalkaliphila]|uniref:Uncharacterized protein n=1 Tax=Candidatus Hakubella thermalkaliphila TaxID=2754717 RepID=A0A6V8NWD3_9ACTN|nr:hypothetical protein HKBW3S09_01954 [Candidatus Hakubella thermalkaliphila]